MIPTAVVLLNLPHHSFFYTRSFDTNHNQTHNTDFYTRSFDANHNQTHNKDFYTRSFDRNHNQTHNKDLYTRSFDSNHNQTHNKDAKMACKCQRLDECARVCSVARAHAHMCPPFCPRNNISKTESIISSVIKPDCVLDHLVWEITANGFLLNRT